MRIPESPTDTRLTVARTPTKLTELLLSKGVSQSTISSQLSVTEGDVRDVSAVKSALTPNGQPVSIIVSGIGEHFPPFPILTSHPPMNPFLNIRGPGIYTMGKVTICAEATTSILNALANLQPQPKPLLAVISSTGISAGPRDVPLLMLPLYKLILHNPHQDKANMERLLAEGASGNKNTWIRGFVSVRPTLLTSGPAVGRPKLRVGTESKPAVGYTVSREDVGKWIFDEVVANEGRDRWVGEKVTLTS